jgi:hypothetical protein
MSTAVSELLDVKQLHGGPASVVSVAPTTPPHSGHINSPAIKQFLARMDSLHILPYRF